MAEKLTRSRRTNLPVPPPVVMEFEVVRADEARTWIRVNHESRFAQLKEALVEKLKEMAGRKKESLTFPFPPNEDTREIQSIRTACSNAIKQEELPYSIRISVKKRCFVVMHKDTLKKFVGERTNGAD